MMSRPSQLLTLLGIQPAETKPVALLLGLYFFLGIAIVLTQTVAFALFISANGAQMLPYAYLITAVGAALAAFLYLRLGERLSFSGLLTINLVFLIVVSLVYRGGLGLTGLPESVTVFLLPLWFQVVTNLGNLAFWALAGTLFTVRQGKRLFGLVSAGSWVATILGGFIASPLIAWIGMANLLVVAALGLVGALAVVQVILRTCLPPRPEPPRATSASATPRPNLLRSRYVLLIFAFLFAWWLGFNVIHSIFSDRAAQQFADVNRLGAFLGDVAGISGVLALIMTGLCAAPVIQRLGLWGGLLIMPVVVTAVVAGLALSGSLGAPAATLFVLATLAKLLNVGLGFGLDQPAHSILYKPLPDHQVGQVPIIAEGIVQPLAVGSAGVALLIFNALPSSATHNAAAIGMSYLFVVLGIIWIGITVVLIRVYRGALSDALVLRRLGDVPRAMADRSSIALLSGYLHDPYPGAAIYALQSLEGWEQPLGREALQTLIAHPASEVRREALAYIERHGVSEMATEIKARLDHETSATVREAGLRALAASTADAVADLSAALERTEPADLRGALVGLLRHGGIDGVLLAGQTFNRLLTSTCADDRRLAAQVLGEVGVTHFYQPLLTLLQDRAPQVRQAALLSSGNVKHPALWPRVIDACDDAQTQRHAVQALARGAQSALPYIEQALTQGNPSGTSRRALVQACGRIREDRTIGLLERLLEHPQAELRTQVLAALGQHSYHANDIPGRQRVRAQVYRELSYAAWVTARWVDLQTGWDAQHPAAMLLLGALEAELQQARNRALQLLSFVYDAATILQARHALMRMDYGAVDPAQMAYAVELVDTQLPTEDKAAVLALIEILPPAQRLDRLTKWFPQTSRPLTENLLALLAEREQVSLTAGAEALSAWTQACALYAIGETGIAIDVAALLDRCEDPNTLIRKTAQWAWARRGSNQDQLRSNQSSAESPAPNAKSEVNPEMLSTIEKVIILKTVSVFAQTPDAVLAEVADLLEEVLLDADAVLFRKGDPGDSLYLIVQGKVQIRDGEQVLRHMGPREVFGEMALLDNEARSATVLAVEPSQLLRLSQTTFYELLADRPEIATGIIRVLMGYIRNLNQRLAVAEQAPHRRQHD